MLEAAGRVATPNAAPNDTPNAVPNGMPAGRPRVLGAITLVSAESARRYTERDVETAAELARRAALAVERARLYEAALRDRERLAEQAEELLVQNERLQEQAAELEMQAAQLSEQAAELEMSHEQLHQQATELEAGNEQLQETAEELAHRVAELDSAKRDAERTAAERERLIAQLSVERARLTDVFRQAPAFIAVLCGPDHVFEMANDEYYTVVGHRDIVGKPLFEALPEIRGQGFDTIVRNVVATGVPFVGRALPVMLARTPGAAPEQRYVDLIYQPLLDGEDKPRGIVAHGTDVTDQVLAQREVERLLAESEIARADAEAARAEAEAANRAKSEFLAVMSHELRTLLNAIGGYAELLDMGIRGPVNAQQRADLARIQTSQRHLLGLINEVLNYAKLETGSVRYDVSDVSVRSALVAAEELVAPQVQSRGLTLIVADCPPDLCVRADAE